MAGNGGRTHERTSQHLLGLGGVALVVLALLADYLFGGEPGFGLQQAVVAAAGLLLVLLAWVAPRYASRMLALLAASAACLVVVELVLRKTHGLEFSVIHRVDEELLHAHLPNARKVFVHRRANEGRRVEVSINSHGFRGPELSQGDEVPRIAVLGDSNVAAEFSTWEESFCGRLASEVGGGVEVINKGVIGYGPDQSLLLLERKLGGLRPQLVVEVLFADNDFGDLIRNKLFRLGPDGELVRSLAPVAEEFRRELELAPKKLVLEHVVHRARQRRSTRGHVVASERRLDHWTTRVEEWLDHCRASHEEYLFEPDEPAHGMFFDHYDADIALEPWSDSAQLKQRLMRAVLARTKERCEASGIPLLLVVLPSRVDLCDDLESAWIDPDRWPRYRARALTEAFTSIADELGIPYVDLYPHFADDPCALYFRGGDTHWNEAGQALAARVVADRIRADQLLEP